MSFHSDTYNNATCANMSAGFDDLCPYYRIEAFRCSVAVRNIQSPCPSPSGGAGAGVWASLRTPSGAATLMTEMRSWAERHSEYGIFTFNYFYILADGAQEFTLLTLRNMGIAVAVIALISFLLIPSAVGTAVVVVAVISMEVGVVGFLGLWGVNLDTVSSISLLLSVGFSVDLTAHIVHAFVAADDPLPTKRAIKALENFGSPILQGTPSFLLHFP